MPNCIERWAAAGSRSKDDTDGEQEAWLLLYEKELTRLQGNL